MIARTFHSSSNDGAQGKSAYFYSGTLVHRRRRCAEVREIWDAGYPPLESGALYTSTIFQKHQCEPVENLRLLVVPWSDILVQRVTRVCSIYEPSVINMGWTVGLRSVNPSGRDGKFDSHLSIPMKSFVYLVLAKRSMEYLRHQVVLWTVDDSLVL